MRFEFNDDSQKICNSADVVNYGIQCDICGNKFQSVSNINGRRYCVGCYYKTFIKDNQQTEIDQLKQQLAEKDKEIEDWKQKTQTFLNRVNEQNYEIANNNPKQLAIQELEKVKELLLNEYKKYPIVYDKTNDIVAGALDRDKVNEIIDQQIKELKRVKRRMIWLKLK